MTWTADSGQLADGGNDLFVVNLGESPFTKFPIDVQLTIQPDTDESVRLIVDRLLAQKVLLDYSI